MGVYSKILTERLRVGGNGRAPNLVPHVATKGVWMGLCNRTACQRPPATHWNRGSRAYYCAWCAHQINKAMFLPHIEALCSPDPEGVHRHEVLV